MWVGRLWGGLVVDQLLEVVAPTVKQSVELDGEHYRGFVPIR
ncbi:hypothetical protein BN874_660004 [Candidatus Contendobacter odensis Run_B_J11]|uniref:Uncharacterized protein n=1 Tax=Candidatus Contendobacter odensis Run_B_J11 TaxID=1400861 RepID=A0A7U7GFG7_9GAMM|nr:hypothetical protein BN874_660004 [Candidatus Contendobacter odensis Run_B_J11]